MKKLLPYLILSPAAFPLSISAWAQCHVPMHIKTTTNYCLPAQLDVSVDGVTDQPREIVWYKDGQRFDSAFQLSGQGIDATQTVTYGSGTGSGPNQFNGLAAMVVDQYSNIYAADAGNARVMKFTRIPSNATLLAGGNGFGTATNQLPGVHNIFVDYAGNLYTRDANLRIMKWPPGATNGTVIATAASPSWQKYGYGLYVDCQENLYVSNTDLGQVEKWPPGATTPIIIAGGNGPGNAANQLNGPTTLCMDDTGNLYILDENNYRVQKWSPGATTGITVAGGNGYGHADNQVVASGMWVDGQGVVFVVNSTGSIPNYRVEKWVPGAATGVPTLSAPNDNNHNGPWNVAMDPDGNILVSDASAGIIIKYLQIVGSTSLLLSPTQIGTYYAVWTDMQGHSVTTDSIHLDTAKHNIPSLAITASATSTAVCTPITFAAQPANLSGPPTFQWEVSGVKAGGDSSSYTNNLFANGDQVYCIMTSDTGCTTHAATDTSNIITLSIDPHGTASVAITADPPAICKGDTATFLATVTNGSAHPTFEWLLDGKSIEGDDSAAYHSDSLSNGDVLYCLITSDDVCGLAKSNSIALPVHDPPTVAANQVVDIAYGKSLTLDPIVNGDVATWRWKPSTGLSDSTIRNPIAKPPASILYTLTITSPGGCRDSGTIKIDVYTPLSIPNAFTPDGDGRNDIFYVLGAPADSRLEEFVVFDRWGQAVFRTHDTAPGDRNAGWNGNSNGRPAPPDTYAYIAVLRFANGTRQVYKGTVTLIR